MQTRRSTLLSLAASSAAFAQCEPVWRAGPEHAANGAVGPLAAATVWDPDGVGPAGEQLVVVGQTVWIGHHSTAFARFDGRTWNAIGTNGASWPGSFKHLSVFEGRLIGAGPGNNNSPIGHVSYLDGNIWREFDDTQIDGALSDIEVHGADLIAAGTVVYQGAPIPTISAWNGSDWRPLPGLTGEIRDLHSDGQHLYAAGDLTVAGALTSAARWDGATWIPLGPPVEAVEAVTVFNEQPVIGGNFAELGGEHYGGIARWDGARWRRVGRGVTLTGPGRVRELFVYDERLFAAGGFSTSLHSLHEGVAAWNGDFWEQPGQDLSLEDEIDVRRFLVYAGSLYAVGDFGDEWTAGLDSIARFDGELWLPAGNNISSPILAGIEYEGRFVAGGGFAFAEGALVNGIAEWDGAQWSPLGAGFTSPQASSHRPAVHALAEFEGDLIAGGFFALADGLVVNSVARWNGSGWRPIGMGIGFGSETIHALAIYEGDLIAGGDFPHIFGQSTPGLSRWDGRLWQGVGGEFSGLVRDIVALGSDLYAAGEISLNEQPAAHIVAHWDGGAWSQIGQAFDREISDLEIYQGDLYAGGRFRENLVRWDGSAWDEIGFDDRVGAMTLHNGFLAIAGDGGRNSFALWDGSSLRIGQAFFILDLVQSLTSFNGDLIAGTNIADTSTGDGIGVNWLRLSCRCYADCDQSSGSLTLDVFDFLCFQDAFAAGNPYADCDHSGSLDVFDFLCFQDAFVGGCQ